MCIRDRKNIAQLIQNFLREDNGKNYKQVHKHIHARKLMDSVKNQITIVTQEVSVEEFDHLALEEPASKK